LCSYNIMQKHNFLHVKSTFLNISIQFITTQHPKWCGSTQKHQKGHYMFQMGQWLSSWQSHWKR
jgi:hypothetical protein